MILFCRKIAEKFKVASLLFMTSQKTIMKKESTVSLDSTIPYLYWRACKSKQIPPLYKNRHRTETYTNETRMKSVSYEKAVCVVLVVV